MATQTFNQSFFAAQNGAPSSFMTFAPESFSDFQLPTESFMEFNNVIFSETDEGTPLTANLQKGSKKISKPESTKIIRKKHNRARNPWTPKEDAKLVELMKKHGQSWAMISASMEGRTGKQIRDRFLNKLRPNIKCGDWTVEEDELMVKLLGEIGHRWSVIATHLPGRTEGQVKNRYYSCIKKRLQSNGAPSQPTTRTVSEAVTSFPSSPEVEDNKFDFEFDTMMNGCATFTQEQILPSTQPANSYMISQGPYNFEEDTYSEESTANSDQSNQYFLTQPQSPDNFFVPVIEKDSHIDEMLGKVTNYYLEKSIAFPDIDSYFSDDLRCARNNEIEQERLSQLAKRKAYLELALAKTLQEMKSL